MASRVVPGMSLTMVRSCPSSPVAQRAFAHVGPTHQRQLDDMPFLLGLVGVGGGRRLTISSKRSPRPSMLVLLMAMGSPRPRL